MTGLQVCTAGPRLQAGLPCSFHPACKHGSTSLPCFPGREGKGRGRGRKGKFFPPLPPCRGAGEGQPRPQEAAVRSRQGGQTCFLQKPATGSSTAATAHGFPQQQQRQLSLQSDSSSEKQSSPPVGPSVLVACFKARRLEMQSWEQSCKLQPVGRRNRNTQPCLNRPAVEGHAAF